MARILGYGTRRRAQAFTHLQSHYLCRGPVFGCPGKGNDKGKVEALAIDGTAPFQGDDLARARASTVLRTKQLVWLGAWSGSTGWSKA